MPKFPVPIGKIYLLVITSTVSNFEKSTAVSIFAYLSVIFFVFITCFTVPMCIPLGYIPPIPDVSKLSPSIMLASVGIYVPFRIELLSNVPLTIIPSLVVFIILLTALEVSIIVCTLAVVSVTDITCPY